MAGRFREAALTLNPLGERERRAFHAGRLPYPPPAAAFSGQSPSCVRACLPLPSPRREDFVRPTFLRFDVDSEYPDDQGWQGVER